MALTTRQIVHSCEHTDRIHSTRRGPSTWRIYFSLADDSAVTAFDDHGATGTWDLRMPFIPLGGETLTFVCIFALTELGFPGQMETKRIHPVVVIESKTHLAQKTRCHKGAKATRKTLRPSQSTLRKSLLWTTSRSRGMHNWAIDVGPSMASAQARTSPVNKLHRTLGHPATPVLVNTLKDSEPAQK